MLNFKRGSDQDVESLIESMLRLIDYMNSSPNFKRNIFQSFSNEDLGKILKNLNDQNMQLRKVSCIFLCSILGNSQNCEQFMQYMEIIPINSKITLNSVPDKMGKYLNEGIFKKLNNVQVNDNTLCWYYSTQMAKDQLTNLSFVPIQRDVKKLLLEFIDPIECLVGVNYQKQIFEPPKPRQNISPLSKSPIQKETPQKFQSTIKTQYDFYRHRQSDNSRAIKTPGTKKYSQDWKSVSIDPKYKLKG